MKKGGGISETRAPSWGRRGVGKKGGSRGGGRGGGKAKARKTPFVGKYGRLYSIGMQVCRSAMKKRPGSAEKGEGNPIRNRPERGKIEKKGVLKR